MLIMQERDFYMVSPLVKIRWDRMLSNGLCPKCPEHAANPVAVDDTGKKLTRCEFHSKEEKDFRASLRVKIIDLYGGKCVCCGEKEISFMTIDHISGIKDRNEKRGYQLYSQILRGLKDKNAFQLLCWNCNCSKRDNNNKGCSHQIGYTDIESLSKEENKMAEDRLFRAHTHTHNILYKVVYGSYSKGAGRNRAAERSIIDRDALRKKNLCTRCYCDKGENCLTAECRLCLDAMNLEILKEKIQCIREYGSECYCCKENKIDFLTIEHMENNGGKHRKEIGNNIYNWLTCHNFPKDLNLKIACYNCNSGRNLSPNKTCPHQNKDAPDFSGASDKQC